MVGHLSDHTHVVCDHNDRSARLVAEPSNQIEDLRLDGDIERRGGLVGDEQLRLAGQRHGDHHSLPHPARELVRVRIGPGLRIRYADQLQHLDRVRVRLGPASGQDVHA